VTGGISYKRIVTCYSITSTVPKVRLFISHASDDAVLAAHIVALFRAALNLPAEAIRCTSVDGHRLPGGADTDEQLRRELQETDALVGILSASGMRSTYVLIELGARWVLNKHLLPLLAPGTPASVLGGPLIGLNALRADNPAELFQMVSEVAEILHIRPESPPAYHRHIEQIVSATTNVDAVAAGRDGKLSPLLTARQKLDEAVSRQLLSNSPELPEGVLNIAWKPGPESLDIEVRNISPLNSLTITVKVMDIYLWSEEHHYFVEPDDLHVAGGVGAILHVRQPELNAAGYYGPIPNEQIVETPLIYLFLSVAGAGHQLQFATQVASSLMIHTIRTPGIWRLRVRALVSGDSIYRRVDKRWELAWDTVMFFRWDGKTAPVPCQEPDEFVGS
jgi:hypothetical protein